MLKERRKEMNLQQPIKYFLKKIQPLIFNSVHLKEDETP